MAGFRVGGSGALHRAEARVRARRSQGATGRCRPRRGQVGLSDGRATVRLGVGKVVGGREVQVLGLLPRSPRVRRGVEAGGAGNRAGRRRLLEVGKAAGFGAVSGAVSLLVAAEAKLVGPEVKTGHCAVRRRVVGVGVVQ